MKENDGKAAKKHLGRKIMVMMLIFGVFLVVGSYFWVPSSSSFSRLDRKPVLRGDLPRRGGPGQRHQREGYPEKPLTVSRSKVEGLMHKNDLSDQEKQLLITSGMVHLVNINPVRGGNFIGTFCRLNWEAHQKDPSAVPMFRDLQQKSPHCQNYKFDFPLRKAVMLAREYEEKKTHGNNDGTIVTAVPPSGFVFHESRCGSTLVANALASAYPQTTRVYSESGPPLTALLSCGEEFERCDAEVAAEVLKDVVYLMGRFSTTDKEEKGEDFRLFFKIQSAGSKALEVFRIAFPQTPWIFVYREPVQVMMSHFDVPDPRQVNCLRAQRRPPKAIYDILRLFEVDEGPERLNREEFCAAHLATLCKKALDTYVGTKTGELVNYVDLPSALIDYIFPHHFGMVLNDAAIQRIEDTSSQYSKGRGGRKHEWVEDSSKKEKKASQAIRDASNAFLMNLYEAMEARKPLDL